MWNVLPDGVGHFFFSDMIYLIITYLFIIAGDIFIDWFKIEKLNQAINHFSDAIAVGLAYLFGAWMVSLFVEISFLELLSVVIPLPAARWLLHDLGLNLARGKPFDYLGENSVLDAFLKRVELNQFIIKGAALVASVLFTIIIWTL